MAGLNPDNKRKDDILPKKKSIYQRFADPFLHPDHLPAL